MTVVLEIGKKTNQQNRVQFGMERGDQKAKKKRVDLNLFRV